MSRTSWRSYSLSVLCASLLAACSSGGGGTGAPQAPATTVSQPNSAPVHLGSTTYQDSRSLNANNNANVANDTQLTLKVFDLNSSQVQATTQTEIAQAKTVNRKWYLTFDNVLPEDVKTIIFPENVTGALGSGLASVYLNNQVLSSPSNSSSFIDLASESLNTAGITLDGRGVNLAIIDGYAKTTVSGFQKTPVNLTYEARDYLYSIHPEYSPESNPIPYLASEGSHGTYVGLVIAGKRELSGVAPQVNLVTAPIRQYDYEIGKVMERVNDYNYANSIAELGNKVHIINNSYSIPDSEEYHTSPTDSPRDTFHSIYLAMEKIVKSDNAPLFVYATGNTNYQKYLENYVLKKNADGTTVTRDTSNTALQPELVRDLSETERRDFYDVSFGLKLDSNTSLAHILDNKELANHTLTVSGYYLDISGVQYYIDQTIKDYLLQGKFNYTTTELFAEARKRLSQANLSNRYGIQDEMYIPYPNAIHCGVTQWHCITGDYTFYYPYNPDSSSPDYIPNEPQRISTIDGKKVLRLTGTSFAAPQVSAIAALVKQQFPWMTATQLKQTLLTTARDVGKPGVDEVFGWGIVNAAAAVNGPALFYAGDFDAQLNRGTSIARNYYFNNSIFGRGGLHVSGTPGDYLYLTGSNEFQGRLLVKSGNVVVANRGLISGFNKDYEVTPQVAARITVNSEGRFYAINAQLLSDVTVNGGASLRNTTIGGNLTINPGATLQIDLGQPGTITVKQRAQLQGNLQLIRTQDYVPTTSGGSGNNLATVLLTANSLTANLNNYSIDNSALVNSNIYVKGNQLVIDIVANRPSTVSSGLAFTRLQSGDAGVVVAGSEQLDQLFALADSVSLASGTPAPSMSSSATTSLAPATSDTSNFTAHHLSAAQLDSLQGTASVTSPELTHASTAVASSLAPASVATGITLAHEVQPEASATPLSTEPAVHPAIPAGFHSSSQLDSAWNTGRGVYDASELPSSNLTLNGRVLTRYKVDDPTIVETSDEFRGEVRENSDKDLSEGMVNEATGSLETETDFDFNHDPTSVKPLTPEVSIVPNRPSIPQELPPTQLEPTPPTYNNSLVSVDGDKKPPTSPQAPDATSSSNSPSSSREPILDPTLDSEASSNASHTSSSSSAVAPSDVTLGNPAATETTTPGSNLDKVDLTTDDATSVVDASSTSPQPSNSTTQPSNPATEQLLRTAQAIQNLGTQDFLALSYSSWGNAYAGVSQLAQHQEQSSGASWFSWGMSQQLQQRSNTTAYYQGSNLSNHFTQTGTQVTGSLEGYRQDVGVLLSNATWSLGVMLGHSNFTYAEDAQIAGGYDFSSKVRSYSLRTQAGYLFRSTPQTSYFVGADLGMALHDYASQRNLASLGQATAQHADWGLQGALGAGYNYAVNDDVNLTGTAQLGLLYNHGAEFSEQGQQATSKLLSLSLQQEASRQGYLHLSQQLSYKFGRGNSWWERYIPSWRLPDNMERFEFELGGELSLRLGEYSPSWTAQLGQEFSQLRNSLTTTTSSSNSSANSQVSAVFAQDGYGKLHTGLKVNLSRNLGLRVAYQHQHATTYRQNEVNLMLSLKIN